MGGILSYMKDFVNQDISHVEIIKVALRERGWSAADLSRASGVSSGVLSRYFNASGISADNLYAIQKALGLDLPVRLPRPIPVISWVQAGSFADVVDLHDVGESGEGDQVHSIKKTGPNAFALRVEGESMMPRYMPGDIIVIDPAVRCDNGCPCVVVLNGEATFKIFRETDEAVILEPTNDKYPEIIVRKDRAVDFRVVGKVVDLIPKL